MLTTGIPITLTPINTGGAVPVTGYGFVSTLAGNGAAGSTNGTGTSASFNNPQALTTDPLGNVYVVDASNLIRKITPAGVVTTFAGGAAVNFADGIGSAAAFRGPSGIVSDALVISM